MNCTRKDCANAASWKPYLVMRASVKSTPLRATFTQLNLCERHKDEASLEDFLSPSSWDKIVRFLREAGKPAPRRQLTTLHYELIDSPESTDAEILPF